MKKIKTFLTQYYDKFIFTAFCVKMLIISPAWTDIAALLITAAFSTFLSYLEIKNNGSVIHAITQKLQKMDNDIASLRLKTSSGIKNGPQRKVF